MLKQLAVVVLALEFLILNGCGGGGGDSNGGAGGTANTGTLQCTLLTTGSVFSPGFNDGFIYQIAVDATNVYWIDTNPTNNTSLIKSISKNGGIVTSLATGLGGVNAFTMDDTTIYWTEHILATGAGSIKSVPKVGGVVTVLASGTPPGSIFDVFFPASIVLDSTFVYWSEGGVSGAVRRVPKAGGSVLDINHGSDIGGLALNSSTTPTTIFYNSGGNTAGNFFSIPIAGGAPTPLASNVGTNIVGDLINDGTSLFGAERENPGRVFSVPLAGGNATYLASNLQNPTVATDGTSLYYKGDPAIPGGPGAIVKIAKTGGATTKGLCVAGGTVYNANTMAADANNVYLVGFLNGGQGAGPVGILKAPKP